MGGSSKKQTVGYKYFGKLMIAIGLPVEKLIGINFDNRGWFYGPQTSQTIETENGVEEYGSVLDIDATGLYGKDEGGVSGLVKFYNGHDNQPADPDLTAYMTTLGKPPVAYQGSLAYLLLTGKARSANLTGFLSRFSELLNQSSFYFGNQKNLREMRLWVKRIFKKLDNSPQWYPEKAEIIPRATYGTAEYEFDGLSWEMTDPTKIIDHTTTVHINGDRAKVYTVKITVEALVELRDVSGGEAVGRSGHIVQGGTYGASHNYNEYTLTISDPPQTFKLNKGTSLPQLTQFTDSFTVEVRHGATVRSYATSVDNVMIQDYQYIRFRASENPYSDINPAHAIREIFTSDVAIGLPEDNINEANFKACADLFYSEGLGVSFAAIEEDCNSLIEAICYHVESGVRRNRQTGLIEIVPFRDDWFNIEDAVVFNPSNMVDFTLNPVNKVETVNVLNVSYFDPVRLQTISFPLYNRGGVLNTGAEIPETVNFKYFYQLNSANKVGNWKLKQMSTSSWSGTIVTVTDEAMDINKYDVIRVVIPEEDINILARVTQFRVNASNNEITLDWSELHPYSNEDFDVPPINLEPSPSQSIESTNFELFEMTFREAVFYMGKEEVLNILERNPEATYVMIAAEQPQDNSPFAILHSGLAEPLEEQLNLSYIPTFKLKEELNFTSTLIKLTNVSLTDSVTLPCYGRVGNEIIYLDSYDNITGEFTIKRGVSPSFPQVHQAESKLYILSASYQTDGNRRTEGETVSVKLLTATYSGLEDYSSGNIKAIELLGLPNKPHGPANVKMWNEYNPVYFLGWPMTFSWAGRNRLFEDSTIPLSWFNESIVTEEGTEFLIVVTTNNTVIREHRSESLSWSYEYQTFLDDCATANINIGPSITFEFYSDRNGVLSAYPYTHTLPLLTPPLDLVVVTDATGDILLAPSGLN